MLEIWKESIPLVAISILEPMGSLEIFDMYFSSASNPVYTNTDP